MPVNFAAVLTKEYVRTVTPSALLADIGGWIKATQPASLVHPNGFLVVLLHRADREEWRFHIWPQGRRLISGMPCPIHTHDKVVDSRVLKGELTNVVYSVVETPSGGLPVYEVQYVGDKYDPRATNLLRRSSARVEASTIGEQLVPVGERYSVPAHVFHQAIVAESVCTCTVVRMHSPAPGPVKVVGIDGYPETIGLRRIECSTADTLAAARM